MSYTIFSSSSTALIPQPGRAVNTFPSGLVRVDQTYLGLTAQAAEHRAILAVGNDMPDEDSSPCIDGLKIFPEVQERRREDGFTEYIVSAYGRRSITGQTNSVLKRVTFPELFLQISPLAVLPKVEFLYYSPLKKISVPVGQIPNLTIQNPIFQILASDSTSGSTVVNQIAEMPSNITELRHPSIRWLVGLQSKKWAIRTFNPESSTVVYRTFSHSDKEIINVNSLNFGNFDEIVVEYDFAPFAAIGSQSDIAMHDSNGNFVAMVSSLFT